MVITGDLELGSKGTAPKAKFGTADFLMEVEKRRSIKVSDSQTMIVDGSGGPRNCRRGHFNK